MKPEIRPMVAADWEQFHKLDVTVFPDDMLPEDWFKKRAERDGCFAMDLDGKVIGQLIVTRFGEDEGHLGRIGVSKEHQGKGFGKMLMKKALEWFHGLGDVKKIHLYTQDFNSTAQGLYTKFGFERSGTTWHYFVPYETLQPLKKYSCQEIEQDEIESVGSLYASLPAAQIERFLEDEEFKVLTLKDDSGKVVGVARFTPGFPGSFPFEIARLDCFDDFVAGMEAFALPEYDYVRVTFTDNHKLAELCDKREYHLHHRLFKMSHVLKK